MSTKRIIGLTALLVVVAAALLLWLNVKGAGYPLSVTFVEWTDTYAPAPAVGVQIARAGIQLPEQRGDWARLAITNHGTVPLCFDSRELEYESDGYWLQVPTNGWSGVHGHLWRPGTGSLISVPRPVQVPSTARWRFHFVCALDPVSGVRRALNQATRKISGKETLFFYAPKAMLSPEIPARQPKSVQAMGGSRSIDAINQPPEAPRTTSGPAQQPDSIRISFINVELSQVIEFYAAVAGAQLETNQLGKLPPALISLETKKEVTRSEALQLLEKAFRDQAGIVLSHPDTNHVAFRLRSPQDEK